MWQKLAQFYKDVRQEMKYISWPNKADIKEGTLVVIFMSALVSIFLFVVDFAFSLLMNKVVF